MSLSLWNFRIRLVAPVFALVMVASAGCSENEKEEPAPSTGVKPTAATPVAPPVATVGANRDNGPSAKVAAPTVADKAAADLVAADKAAADKAAADKSIADALSAEKAKVDAKQAALQAEAKARADFKAAAKSKAAAAKAKAAAAKSKAAAEARAAAEAKAKSLAAKAAAKTEARKLYNTRCFACHGPKGDGNGPAAKSLNPKPRNYTDTAWQKKTSNSRIEKIIVRGGPSVGLSPLMPPNPDLANKPEVVKALRRIVRAFGR